MSEKVCPVCGDEFKVGTIDFETDPSVDPQWLMSNPEYTNAFQVRIKCGKCKKGIVCTFHKPSFSGEDEMVSHATKIFADAMRKEGEDDDTL